MDAEHHGISLDHAYRVRLNIDQTDALPPDGNTLRRLVEAHLRYIPFENLSMHGCLRDKSAKTNEPVIPLTLALLRDKILHRNRGGCCFELNGLLGHYLLELGYPVVKLVPCWVYAGPERGHVKSKKAKFRTRQTHAFLLVRTCDDESYIADVGLGEPPLHPLEYGPGALGIEQITPEGMKSRIVREERDWVDGGGRVRKCFHLEWWRPCRACFHCGGRRKVNYASAKVQTLNVEAEILRIKASKFRRRSSAKPRAPFKVFASCPSVRDDAERHLLLQKEQSVASNDGGAVQTKVSAAEIRRKICDMWASLSDDGRMIYKEKAVAELATRKKEADEALALASRAEDDLKEAFAATMKNERSGDSDGMCDGEGGYWEPRLQWDALDAPLVPTDNEPSFHDERPLQSFAEAACIIAGQGSTFAQKIVACVLTRSEKVTISGDSLRVTSPRFAPSQNGGDNDACTDSNSTDGWPVQMCTELESREMVRSILMERFGIELKETTNLSMDTTETGTDGCRLWDHL